jgi:two-component system, cell cycle sensor histidine kinase and response regulator CckA
MPTRNSHTRTTPKTIVFADNDELILEALSELLRSKGYEVHGARDGLEALQVIRKVKPDYAILDIVMPKVDGGRVCWLIRQDPDLRDTPVIAYSSLSAQDFRQFPELSADAYVAKGPLAVAFNNILEAIAHIDKRGRGSLSGGIFGYDGLHSRHLVEEMLRERRHYADVLRALGEGVVELDNEGRILTANPGACEILGRREARVVGEPFLSFCQARDRKAVQDLLSELAKSSRPERWRLVIRLGHLDVPVKLCAIVNEKECTGILLVMESKGTKNNKTAK